MAEPTNPEPVLARLFPIDFEVILNLLPRAQIVVGDIPRILPSLQRIENAAKSRSTFVEQRPEKAEADYPANAGGSE